MASYFVADVRSSMVLITLGAFFATFGGVSGYTVAIKFGGRHVATVFSTMNMCGNFGASLFPIAAGWLVAQTGNWNLIRAFGRYKNGSDHYFDGELCVLDAESARLRAEVIQGAS